MGKKKVPVLLVILFLSISLLFLSLFGKQKDAVAPSTDDINISQSKSEASQTASNLKGKDEALKAALNLYMQKKQQGVDFKNGPCLGEVAPDWVLDIAHKPRTSIDEKPENQCPQLKNGTAHHYIELDPDGKLIRQL